MESDRLFNMFGALALAATDAIRRGAEADIAFGEETAAALNLIGHVTGINIDGLATGLGLSHPGTVRLVDPQTIENPAYKRADETATRLMDFAKTWGS